ncbi:Spo0B domain-containing protein [Massilibacterium senegalense]|uniref:Spo0B domain-containing protein n=1 Tax=Massilibacterium senegalense TaxID=1632858 RepID=UPI000782AFA3|nr:Spo0B domain-containing protein [Massilibacterium senegalense]
MGKNWSTVELLRHVRHDYLNQIQLIKGNLALNHCDRIEQIIDDIIVKAKNDAHLCNLNMPQVAEQLLTFSYESHFFELDYEIVGDVCTMMCLDQSLYDFQSYLFQRIDQQENQQWENELYLFYQCTNGTLYVQYEFEGERNIQDIDQYFTQNASPLRIIHYEVTNNGFELKLEAKCD